MDAAGSSGTSAADALARLRSFLLALSAVLFGGSIVELVLTGHAEDALQLIPFALCAAGLAALLAFRLARGRATLRLLRAVMAVVLLGTLLGIGLHLTANLELAREVLPDAAGLALAVAALTGGVPLLAPGILAVAAILALAATAGDRS